ncbi:uncharacterized protein LOC105638175 isoform X2 [Jatropha curcas]|uniref:uncharacterized protein LOC105638175 isoform X2 n=1 Tax=Jatropha curcas TaxID=180498 RepID=UPI0005FC064B|nr:uncharacterized protein LOC105638175 isoform X2 [Jatropha curcas]
MEVGESVLDAIYEEGDELQDIEDVEMVDLEEGELVDQNLHINLGQSVTEGGRDSVGNQDSQSKNRKRRSNKKRNRKRRGGAGQGVTNIDKFVLDTCRRLKEKKSYMLYTAVGILGISALSDLVKQVDAIQSCGGQMTADGRRSRTGGGILWNIMKTKEPTAYREIMKKSKEFEQFKRQNIQRAPEKKEASSQEAALTDGTQSNVPDDSMLDCQNQHEKSSYEQKHRSVRDRIRAPVSYDDLLGDDPKNDSA